jgi:hypothetical protein
LFNIFIATHMKPMSGCNRAGPMELLYRKQATHIHTEPGAAAVPCSLMSEVSAVLKRVAVESDETNNGCFLDGELSLPTSDRILHL